MINMFKKVAVISSIVSVLLSGCAGGLNVEVDVLDKAYLDSMKNQDGYRKEAMLLANGDYTQSADFIAETELALMNAANEQCFNLIESHVIKVLPESDAARKVLEKDIENLRKEPRLSNSILNDMAYMRERLNEEDIYATTAINRNFGSVLWDTQRKDALPPGMLTIMARRRAVVNKAKEHRNFTLDALWQDCAGMVNVLQDVFTMPNVDIPKFNAIINTESKLVQEQLKQSILGGGSLLANEEGAFHVVKAKERYWASSYNKAFGNGIFGSTSTAIKINGLADYTVKGFSFDGRATASMMRKLAGTTVGFAAAMYGVPIDVMKPDPANGTSQSDVVFDNSTLTEAKKAVDKNAAETELFKASVKRVARTILTYQDDLIEPKGDPKKVNADTYVKAAYAGNLK